MTTTSPIIFYDIASDPPIRPYAPNPSKARYALNFKRVLYKTSWTELPDVTPVRKGLNCPPVRKFADGTEFYTLPIIQDASTGRIIGDSFEIAEYLESTYPDYGGALFPSQTTRTGLDYKSPYADLFSVIPIMASSGGSYFDYANFNAQVDATFTTYVSLAVDGIPFNPITAEQSKKEFLTRAGRASWDDLIVEGEARERLREGFRGALEDLAKFLKVNEGPFLEGEKATYADIIIGGWLKYLSVTMRKEEWEELTTWHEGIFGRLHEALAQYSKYE